jgi:hypothetical protein
LTAVSIDIKPPSGPLPKKVAPPSDGRIEEPMRYQQWPTRAFVWQPTEHFHQPLYFDDIPLERYGQTRWEPLQPVVSGGRFIGAFLAMPYKLVIDGTHDRVYTMGYHRPGSPTPPPLQLPPYEAHAGLAEAAVVLGLAFMLP